MKNLLLFLLSSCVSYQSLTQAVGIGTNTPDISAILHVSAGASASKGLLVTGTYTQGVIASLPDLGAGSRMMFYPGKAAFRAGYVSATQWNNANVGYFSTATGSGTTASGAYSNATGFITIASGNYSNTTGYATTAGGAVSTAIGLYTRAKGYASTVAGMYNDSLLAINETIISATTPLFIVGNGDADNDRSNALVVQKNGNMGIGNSLPNADAILHVNTGASTSKGFLVTGTYNAASTVPDLGAGSRMMFYPGKAAFRSGYVNGTQWDNMNVGLYSTAMGSNTTATGNNSTALGSNTIARGNFSTATGYFTTAGGILSTAMGFSTRAKGYASTVIGMYNDSLLITDETAVNSATPLFIIGNGDESNYRSNALVVQKNGNTGIGNSLPNADALLHVNTGASTSKGFLVTGTYNAASTVPDLGAGSRMMYYPGKAAFRAGSVTGIQWSYGNVGAYSTAMGYNTIASGSYSTAIGKGSNASGDYSTATGESTIASGSASIAMGSGSHATGSYSIAMGEQTNAGGSNSIAMGYVSHAAGNYSTAIGVLSVAGGYNAIAMGYQAIAGGDNSIALGYFAKAKGFASTVIGMYNDSLLITDETSVTAGTPLFIVGNGNAFNARSNALVVRKNGNSECNANLTVQNGKGIIRNTDGTQSKKLSTTTLVNVGLDALGTKTVGVTWPEAFSAAPEAYVGNITGGGGWAEVILSVANVTTTGATLYVSNPRGSSQSPNFTVKIIAIGAQ